MTNLYEDGYPEGIADTERRLGPDFVHKPTRGEWLAVCGAWAAILGAAAFILFAFESMAQSVMERIAQ